MTKRRPRTLTIPAQMAEVMIDRTAGEGGCTSEHLRQAGFNDVEIGRHADAAREIARLAPHHGQA